MQINIEFIEFNLEKHSEIIAGFYNSEWGMDIDETVSSYKNYPNNNILHQTVMIFEDQVIGTGGVYKKVGIQNKFEKYQGLTPWLALLYVKPEFRNKGLGEKLIKQIESKSLDLDLGDIYLFTHTAESLYKRLGYVEFSREILPLRNIALMKKKTNPD